MITGPECIMTYKKRVFICNTNSISVLLLTRMDECLTDAARHRLFNCVYVRLILFKNYENVAVH